MQKVLDSNTAMLDPKFVEQISKQLKENEPLIDGLVRLGYLERVIN